MKTAKPPDVESPNDFIVFDDDEMDAFLHHFETEFNNLMTTLNSLRYSTYPKDFLCEHLVRVANE